MVIKLKQKYKNIKLILVLPCENQQLKWNTNDIKAYESIKMQADKIVYVSHNYTNDCMHRRNRHLVNHSKFCTCYYDGTAGGTEYTIKYAKSKGLKIITCIN